MKIIHKYFQNKFEILVTTVFIVLIVFYRISWVEISYWGEDAATNLWLGYVLKLSELEIGLISSQFIPNPNGMMVFGKLVSLIGSTANISIFLTILNVIILYFFLQNLLGSKNIDFYILLLLSGTSVLIASTAIEFWNQWLLLSINLLILNSLIRYSKSKKTFHMHLLVFLIPLPIFVYLGGLTNSLVFGAIFLYLIFIDYRKNSINLTNIAILTSASALIYWRISFGYFFSNISIRRLTELNGLTLIDRFKYLLNNFLKLPDGLLNLWSSGEKFQIFQIDKSILNNSTSQVLDIFFQFHKFLPLIAFILLISGIVRAFLLNEFSIDSRLGKSVGLLFIFISTTLVISPIYGGPDFLIIKEKSNNLNQHYLFFILIWYLVPNIFTNNKKYKIIMYSNRTIYIFFIFVNIYLGQAIIEDNKNFMGDVQTNTEAPLRDKILVVDFIANEWMQSSDSKDISIKYETFVKDMSWFPVISKEYEKYYQPSPYTEGRLFDYELLRKYEINNVYDGKFFDFIITNIFEPEPKLLDRALVHHRIGRLRVSR